MKNKIVTFLSLGLICLSLSSCNKNKNNDKDITIVYTSDVHCGLDTNIGYSSLYSYKESLKDTNYVSLVDSGDYLQGDFVGAISNGKYVIDVMNKVGYDIITIGNHEFDYGIDVLSTRLKEFNGEVTSCNYTYIGNKEDQLDFVKKYVIKEYGNKKIGYIGITSPDTLVSSDPSHFYEDGHIAYDFKGQNQRAFYDYVQSVIDTCKKDGADYVIILSHLGSLANYQPFSSIDVLKNTSGALAFLDGHAHVTLPWTTYKNKKGEDTLLVDTGYKLNDFASLTISKDGNISYDYFNEYSSSSEMIDSYIDELLKEADKLGDEVVANVDIDLSITDENGIRMVRSREMPIANLVADAYRIIGNSDIGITNGGGVRANLAKGDVTYKDIKNVHPFGNFLMNKKATGQIIIDYLEFTSRKTQSEYVKDGLAFGENGAFAHVSGLKYSIDTSIPSSVVVDETGEFVKVDGLRRVKNVQVLENNNYVDIDPSKEYIVSSHNFLLNSGGDGANMFKDLEVEPSSQLLDYEVLINYIVDVLKGHLKDKYSSVEGRITIL